MLGKLLGIFLHNFNGTTFIQKCHEKENKMQEQRLKAEGFKKSAITWKNLKTISILLKKT